MKEYSISRELKKIYGMLENTTPVLSDCGKICSGKCCKGDSTDGMLLFPGEKELFENKEGFNVYYDERYACYAVSCNGSCDRKIRPLSCRIFPYFIYIKDEKSAPVVAPDVRAADYCPLLKDGWQIDRKFLRAMRISAALAEQNHDIKEFLIYITGLLTDFNSL